MAVVHFDDKEQATCNSLAKKFCDALFSPKEEGSLNALEYLKTRGIEEDIVKKFNIGFFPANRAELLPGKKILAGRIIFPIQDEFGDTVAFSGRMPCEKKDLPEGVPHWLHESYKKSYFVYGLNNTWQHILFSKKVFLVEGQIDLITCYRHGIKNVISLMGTALSQENLSKLQRYADFFYIMLDGDSSGRNGTKNIIKLFNECRIAKDNYLDIPLIYKKEIYDPDKFLSKYGSELLLKFISKAKNNG